LSLHLRAHVYYVRICVPAKLKPTLGRAEIWRSLNSADALEARRRAVLLVARVQRVFARIGELLEVSEAEAKQRNLTPSEIQRLAHQYLKDAWSTTGTPA
jgi:hypothetical protein